MRKKRHGYTVAGEPTWSHTERLVVLEICFLILQESMTRYTSPVNPSVYPHLAVTLLGIGLFFMAWFFVYPLLT